MDQPTLTTPRRAWNPWASWRLVGLVIGLAAALLIAPAIFAGKVLSASDIRPQRDPVFAGLLSGDKTVNPLRFDGEYVFGPDLREARRQVRSGHVPMWMTGVGAGRPLLASQQHAVAFPLTWLAMILPVERAMALILALKVLFAGLGLLVLARSLALKPAPALLAAFGFAFGSYFTSWLEHPHTNGYLMLPWLLWAVGQVVRPAGHPRAMLGLGVALGLVTLGGHPATAAIVIAFVAAYGVTLAIQERGGFDRSRWLRLAGRVAGATALGLLLGAVMILPFFDATGQAVSLERGGPGGPGWILVTLLAPELWGAPGVDSTLGGPGNFAERSAYVGVATLILALAGISAWQRQARFFAVAGVFCLLGAIAQTPVAKALSALPGHEHLNQQRLLILASFCLALLAGFGLQAVLYAQPRARRVAAAGAGLVALACGAVALSTSGAPDVHVDRLIRPALLAGIVLGAIYAMDRVTPSRRAAVALGLVVLTGAELMLSSHGYYRFLSPDEANTSTPAAIHALRPSDPLNRVTAQGVIGPNLALDYGLLDPRVHDHPSVGRYSRLWQALVPSSAAIRTDYERTTDQSLKALDIFSVQRVLFNGPDTARDGLRDIQRLPNGLIISENPAAVPRAFVATRWSGADDEDDALAQVMATGRSRLRGAPVIEATASADSNPAPAPPTAQRITRYEPARVTVRVQADQAGYLVLTDSYYRGWTATVNDRDAKIHPANVAFRAVRVPAGMSTVEFRYRPTAVTGGLAGTGLGLIVAMAGSFVVFRRRRVSFASVAAGFMPTGALVTPWLRTLRSRAQITSRRMENDIREAVGLPNRTGSEPADADLAATPVGSRRRFRSPTTLWVILVGMVLGTIIGASLRPLSPDRFLAEAVVGVDATSQSDADTSAWRTFAETIELPQVARAAVRGGNLRIDPSEVSSRVVALGDRRSRVLRVQARAESPAAAVVLADSVASQAIELTRRGAREKLVDSDVQATFDFEDGLAGFDAGTRFTTRAARLRTVPGGQPPGQRALAFRCESSKPGCGPGAELTSPWNRGTRYLARARVRSATGVGLVRLILGSGSSDVAAGSPTVVAGARYVPLQVQWSPSKTAESAIVALQTTLGTRVDLIVDDVEVFNPAQGRVDPAAEARSDKLAKDLRVRRAAESDAYVRVAAATPSGTQDGGTAAWAALGGAIGALVALTGLVLANQARRRQQ